MQNNSSKDGWMITDVSGMESGKPNIAIYITSSLDNMCGVLAKVNRQVYNTQGYDMSEAVFTTQTRINIGVVVGVIGALACLGGGIGIGVVI